MRFLAAFLPTLAFLAGCDGRPTTLEECDTFILTDLAVHETAITAGQPNPGEAFDLHSDAPGSHLVDIGLWVDASNRSPDTDCVVALYLGGEVPDPEALPDLPLGEAPPESIAGLGELAAAIHVPRDWGETDTASAYVEQLASGPDPVELYVTVATCGEATVEVTLEFWADYCLLDDRDDADPEKVGLESFESVKVW